MRPLMHLRNAVPMVVPRDSVLIVVGGRTRHLAPLKCNGQRWCAPAVQDYESRALPL